MRRSAIKSRTLKTPSASSSIAVWTGGTHSALVRFDNGAHSKAAAEPKTTTDRAILVSLEVVEEPGICLPSLGMWELLFPFDGDDGVGGKKVSAVQLSYCLHFPRRESLSGHTHEVVFRVDTHEPGRAAAVQAAAAVAAAAVAGLS